MRLLTLFCLLGTALSAQDAKPDGLTQDVEKAIKGLVSEKHSESRDARTELIEIGRKAIPHLVKALRAEDSPVQKRHMICEVLGKIRENDAGVLEALSGALADREEFGTSVASVAAAALAWIGDEAAVEALLKVFGEKEEDGTLRVDRDLQLKYECIRAFGILRAREAIAGLQAALEDKKTTQLGPEDDWAHLVAAAAAEALGYIRAEEAVSDLGALLGDTTADPFSERELRWHAARALERITGEDRGSLNERDPTPAITKWRIWYDKEIKPVTQVRESMELISRVDGAIGKFNADLARLPVTLEELVSKPEKDGENWKGPYVEASEDVAKTFSDGWQKRLELRVPGTGAEYDLFSTGADRAPWGGGFNADLYNHDKWIAVSREKTVAKMSEVQKALALYRKEQESYPTSLRGLWDKPEGEVKEWKPYLEASPVDAYGSPLIYRVPGKSGKGYDLTSSGANKALGADDTGVDEDITVTGPASLPEKKEEPKKEAPKEEPKEEPKKETPKEEPKKEAPKEEPRKEEPKESP